MINKIFASVHFSHRLSHYCSANEGNIRPTAESLKWVCKEMNRRDSERGLVKGMMMMLMMMMVSGCFLDMTLESKKKKKKLWNESEVYAVFNPAGWQMCSCSPLMSTLAIMLQPAWSQKRDWVKKCVYVSLFVSMEDQRCLIDWGKTGYAVNIYNVFLFCS